MSKANVWREKAKHRTATAAQMLTLPSGMEVKARRPSIEGLMIAGRLPEYITREYLGGKMKKATLEEVTAKVEEEGVDGDAMLEYMRFLVCETCIEPRVVMEGAADDDDEKVNVKELPPHDLDYLYKFAVNQLPEATVATVHMGSGALTVGAVNNFRDSAEGAIAPASGGNGAEIQPAPV